MDQQHLSLMYRLKIGAKGQVHFPKEKIPKGKKFQSPIEIVNATQDELEFLYKTGNKFIIYNADKSKEDNSTDSEPKIGRKPDKKF